MTIYHVSTIGSNGSDGLSEGNAWASVEYGLAQVSAGDTIYMHAGTYNNASFVAGDLGPHPDDGSLTTGTLANPIVIQAAPGDEGLVIITTTGGARWRNMDYLTFDNLIFQKAEYFRLGENLDSSVDCTGFKFTNCIWRGFRNADCLNVRGGVLLELDGFTAHNCRTNIQGASGKGNFIIAGTRAKSITVKNGTITEIGNDGIQVSNLLEDFGTWLVEDCSFSITRPYQSLDSDGNEEDPNDPGGFLNSGENAIDFKSVGAVTPGTATLRRVSAYGYRPGDDPQDVSGSLGPAITLSTQTSGGTLNVDSCTMGNNTINLKIAGLSTTTAIVNCRFDYVSDFDRQFKATGSTPPAVDKGADPVFLEVSNPGSTSIKNCTFWSKDDGYTPTKAFLNFTSTANITAFEGNLFYADNANSETTNFLIDGAATIVVSGPNLYSGITPHADIVHVNDVTTAPSLDTSTWMPATPDPTGYDTGVSEDFYGVTRVAPVTYGAVQAPPVPTPSPGTNIVTKVWEQEIAASATVDVAIDLTDAGTFNGNEPDFFIYWVHSGDGTPNTASSQGISTSMGAGISGGTAPYGTTFATRSHTTPSKCNGGIPIIIGGTPPSGVSYQIFDNTALTLRHTGNISTITDGIRIVPKVAGTMDINVVIMAVYGGDAIRQVSALTTVTPVSSSGTFNPTLSATDIKPNFIAAFTTGMPGVYTDTTTVAGLGTISPSMGFWSEYDGAACIGMKTSHSANPTRIQASVSNDRLLNCQELQTEPADGTWISVDSVGPGEVTLNAGALSQPIYILGIAVEFLNPENVSLVKDVMPKDSTSFTSSAARHDPVGSITLSADTGGKASNVYSGNNSGGSLSMNLFDGTTAKTVANRDYDGRSNTTLAYTPRFDAWAIVDRKGVGQVGTIYGTPTYNGNKELTVASFTGTPPTNQTLILTLLFSAAGSKWRLGDDEIVDWRKGDDRVWLEY